MEGVLLALQPLSILAALTGVVLGIIFGAIPGLSATLGIALLLPVTFLLPVDQGLIMLGGVYAGGIYGGSISAILLNVPGTVAAVMTSIEGHAMARRGQAQYALGLSATGSGIGGLFSALVLLFLAPLLARWALAFGSAEYVALIVFSLVVVTMMLPTPLLGNAAGCFIGLAIATIGVDPAHGYPRFTYGIYELVSGFPLLPVLIGFFALPQVLFLAWSALREMRYGKSATAIMPSDTAGPRILPSLLRNKWNLVRSSILGTGMGILPAIGPTVTPVTAHAIERRFSRDDPDYGKGSAAGLLAAETSNNANVGGSLIPLLALGVPGSGAAAVFIGALTIHGLSPGPLMFQQNGDVLTAFFVGFIIVNILMMVLGFYGARYFALVLKAPSYVIAPFIVVFAMFGSYASGNGMFFVWMLLVSAALALMLRAVGIPILAVLMGFILGALLEEQLIVMVSSFIDPWDILARPIAMGFAVITILTIVLLGRQRIRDNREIAGILGAGKGVS